MWMGLVSSLKALIEKDRPFALGTMRNSTCRLPSDSNCNSSLGLQSTGLPGRGVRLIFSGDYISLVVVFKGLNVILGLYECNYSLTRAKELGTAAG